MANQEQKSQVFFRRVLAVVSIAFGLLYLLNPGAGVIEALPDNLPLVGNLDEAAAMALLLWGGSQFWRSNSSNAEEEMENLQQLTDSTRQTLAQNRRSSDVS